MKFWDAMKATKGLPEARQMVPGSATIAVAEDESQFWVSGEPPTRLDIPTPDQVGLTELTTRHLNMIRYHSRHLFRPRAQHLIQSRFVQMTAPDFAEYRCLKSADDEGDCMSERLFVRETLRGQFFMLDWNMFSDIGLSTASAPTAWPFKEAA